MNAQDRPFGAVVGQALYVTGQLEDQRDRYVVGPLHFDDAESAYFELAGDCRRRRSDKPFAILADDRLVVADQGKATVEQA